MPCDLGSQTKKEKAEVAQQAKAASEDQQQKKPKAKSKEEREAERHRKKIAGQLSRKGKNTLMEVRFHAGCWSSVSMLGIVLMARFLHGD